MNGLYQIPPHNCTQHLVPDKKAQWYTCRLCGRRVSAQQFLEASFFTVSMNFADGGPVPVYLLPRNKPCVLAALRRFKSLNFQRFSPKAALCNLGAYRYALKSTWASFERFWRKAKQGLRCGGAYLSSPLVTSTLVPV